MSNGGTPHSSEPNLTPLLDMVLQLVLFFMMVANLTMEIGSPDIQLPVSQSPRPGGGPLDEVLFLNISSKGQVVVLGRDRPLTSRLEIRRYLEDALANGGEGHQPENILVIIRGDRNASYSDVYRVMKQCSEVGFHHIQVRAAVKAS